MSTRLTAAQTRSREEAARNALALENAQSLAIAFSEKLRTSNLLLRQQLRFSVQPSQSVQPHVPSEPSPFSPILQIASPLQIPADILQFGKLTHFYSTNHQYRGFEDKAAMVTSRNAFDLKGPFTAYGTPQPIRPGTCGKNQQKISCATNSSKYGSSYIPLVPTVMLGVHHQRRNVITMLEERIRGKGFNESSLFRKNRKKIV